MFNARHDWSAAAEGRREYRTFAVDALTPHIGAVVRDIDLAQPLSNEQAQDIHDAWLDWKVLLFRDQRIDRDQHKAFARRWGSLHVHPMQHIRGGDPEILVVKTTRNSPYTAGDGWHTDVTCDEVPPLGSMLYLTEVPESGGGDTLFADMYLAFEMLSEPMRKFLEGLTAVHDGAGPYVGSYKSTPPEGGYPRNEHPVVVRHGVRNALLPVSAQAATDAGALISGLLVTEQVFQYPGMGRLFLDAVSGGDYPVLLSAVMITAASVFVVNLAADVLYGVLDPRIRYGAR